MSSETTFSDLYCNPLPLPDLGPGICCRQETPDLTYFCGEKRDYREVADPELLYHDGIWYMYPSVRQAYVSRDLVSWEYHPLKISGDLGYAPSVVRCGNRFLLTSSILFRDKVPKIYAAPTPLGPFENLGEPLDRHGNPLQPEYLDPSLFVDEDGRLYLYWGCAPYSGGIYGIELDADNPTRAVGDAVKLLDYDSTHVWEHYGEYHEHTHHGWDEGVAMFKHRGTYYLQYAACGTIFRHYAIGCYRSDVSPLGPFRPPQQAMACSPHGIVTGSGHGGMAAGPDGSVWQFYTCLIRRVHFFERRVGMDRVQFDPDGNPHVRITATPQSVTGGDIGLVPVSVNKPVRVSSWSADHYGNYAVDECTHTWWEPTEDDRMPQLEVDLVEDFAVSAVRILWCEPNLDYHSGRQPEPVRFKIEMLSAAGEVLPATVDRSGNTVDRIVEFVAFTPVTARKIRLEIQRGADKIRHGVTDFTVFGMPRQ